MADPVTQMVDHFSLAHFERSLDGLTPPDEPFDPRGSWENRYRLVEDSRGRRTIGALRIARTPAGEGCRLTVEQTKGAAGGSLWCRMDLDCAADDLATPREWILETVVRDAEAKPIEDTRLRETGVAQDDGLEVRIGDDMRRIAVPRPFTFHWALFEAVQRLARERQTPHTFTLVDRLNYQVKPDHTLAFRASADVELGGRRAWREEKHELEVGAVFRPVPTREGAVRTQACTYEHVGAGILPTVYWVDARGRLLLVLSGLIGYIFDPSAQV